MPGGSKNGISNNPNWRIGGSGAGRNVGGRLGTKNKIQESFLKAMANDFELHGAEAIVKVRETKPEVYLKIVAGLVPRELKVETQKLDQLPDEEIIAALDKLRSIKSKVVADAASLPGEEATIN